MPDRTCATCRFMEETVPLAANRGFCRRFPPGWPNDIQRSSGGVTAGWQQYIGGWPVVRDVNWCGEHQPRGAA
jgi:hypothetical protein